MRGSACRRFARPSGAKTRVSLLRHRHHEPRVPTPSASLMCLYGMSGPLGRLCDAGHAQREGSGSRASSPARLVGVSELEAGVEVFAGKPVVRRRRGTRARPSPSACAARAGTPIPSPRTWHPPRRAASASRAPRRGVSTRPRRPRASRTPRRKPRNNRVAVRRRPAAPANLGVAGWPNSPPQSNTTARACASFASPARSPSATSARCSPPSARSRRFASSPPRATPRSRAHASAAFPPPLPSSSSPSPPPPPPRFASTVF